MRKIMCAVVLSAGLCLVSAPAANASSFTFDVVVNTTALIGNSGAPFYLDFQLNEGSGPLGNNSVAVSNFDFGVGGSSVGAPSTFGGASGSLTSSVMLADSSFFNELFQQFTPGNDLHFRVTLTGNPDTVSPVTPDLFAFGILDNTLGNIPTTGEGDSLLLVNINKTNLGLGDIRTGASTSPAGVTAAAVPEPTTLLLLGTGLAGAGARRWRRQAR